MTASDSVEVEHDCSRCGYADMVTVPGGHYAKAASLLVERGYLDPEEAGLVQAHAMLAIADAIKALAVVVEGGQRQL